MIRVGAVQAEPDGRDVKLIPRRARPRNTWTATAINNTYIIHDYMANSMARDSPQMDRIQAAVKKAGMVVVLGYSEHEGTSLCMAQAFISSGGEIVHHRRKVKPTHIELIIWDDGHAELLKPPARWAGSTAGSTCSRCCDDDEYSQGVHINVASWLTEFEMPDPRKICVAVLVEKNLEENNLAGNPVTKTPGGGFSMTFGPDGKPLDINYPKAFIDVIGRYARADLFIPLVNPSVDKYVTLMKK
ncbi:putative Nitrilase [Pleurostoma richardsiae]|uniref:nitrilase n=1 Tax=Pleurostoma richardsiae TaxID=41990 RepID=A0AA38VQS9_9PEZI|nr:putative Nitrilase [Pleurostoma richardsiae]